MLQVRFKGIVKLWNDSGCQNLAEFDSPLIERVDIPNDALRKYAVLVERNQFAKNLRREPVGKDGVGRPITLESSMWNQPIRSSFRLHLFGCFAKCKRFGLCKYVGHQEIVMISQGIKRLAETNKIAGDQFCSLMNQLIERVLTIRARFAPIDWSRFVIDGGAFKRDMLPVAFHCQLLEICWESFQILIVGQNGNGLGIKKIGVPDGQQSQ